MRRVVTRLAVSGTLIIMGAARAPAVTAQEPAVVKVHGVVFDSLRLVRADGAVVEFADATNPGRRIWQATSDHTGRFAVDIPSGSYLVRVRSSLLDSLDVEAPVRAITVGGRTLDLPLALPSLDAIARALCGTLPGEDVNGVLVLRVGDASNDTPGGATGTAMRGPPGAARVDTASVALEWESLEFTAAGVVRAHHSTHAAAAIGETFRLCGPPPGASVRLSARANGRITHTTQFRLPSNGVAFQDIWLRLAPRREGDGATADDRPRLPRTVTVTVTDAGGQPLRGAVVRGPGGAGARTDEQGVARVQDVPDGSADIDVTALGYAPARKTVTPERAAPDTLTIALARTELSPVHVTARRDSATDPELSRRLAYGGTVLTAAEIARRGARTWMDAARTIAGVSVGVYTARRGSFPIRRLEMRSTGGKCEPAIWLDGQRTQVTDNDWDQFVALDQVDRIEVYGAATVPNEFRGPGLMCGAVLIWTVAGVPRAQKPDSSSS